jgi:hypothetical protein
MMLSLSCRSAVSAVLRARVGDQKEKFLGTSFLKKNLALNSLPLPIKRLKRQNGSL